jgi:hypothetical protein
LIYFILIDYYIMDIYGTHGRRMQKMRFWSVQ